MKNMFVINPLNIPPPIVLTKEGDKLKFLIREDINTPEALSYIAMKLSDLPISDMLIDHIPRPIFCMGSFLNGELTKCSEGLNKCITSKKLFVLYKLLGVNPGLVCCKNNEAIMLKISELNNKRRRFCSCGFEIDEIPLDIKGIRL